MAKTVERRRLRLPGRRREGKAADVEGAPPPARRERRRLQMGASFRLFDAAYRRLGRHYPTVAVSFVLLGSIPVVVVAVLILRVYERMSPVQLLQVMGLSLAVVAITTIVQMLRSHRRLAPVRAWIRGDRDQRATLAAWETAIGVPGTGLREPLLVLAWIVVPITVGGWMILDLPGVEVIGLLAGVVLTAGYATALNYFTLESVLRPVVADIATHLDRDVELTTRAASLRAKLLASLPLINVITGVVVAGLTKPGEGVDALGLGVLFATAVAFTISLLLTLRVSAVVTRPVNDLRRASELVEQGNLDVAVPVTSGDEIGRLVQGFNRMVAGLAERERIREAFGTYVDPGVAERILSDDTGTSPTGEEVEVTVLFLDVRDFTSFAHSAAASEVVATLNRLFSRVVPIIHEHGGHVDKFIGDGLLAVFGAPQRHPDHPRRALSAAIEIGRQVEEEFGDELEIGIGLNSGTVVAGSIGGAGRLNFSVIGDAVNVAARVEAATRKTGDSILLTEPTRDLLGEEAGGFVERPGVELRGVPEPVTLYSPDVRS